MNNRYVRLTKDSFIRNYQTHGYITNQLTNKDQIFNETGADFLSVLSRQPTIIEELVKKLLKIYKEVSHEEIKEDFFNFIKALEKDKFVVTGYTPADINAKEPSFSYNNAEVKTIKKFFSDDFQSEGTSEYIYDNLIYEYQLSSLTIELTKLCNEKCIHCYLPDEVKENGKSLNSDFIKKVLDEASEMGLLQVTFTGGEPFLHPQIKDILQYARKKDLMISILSNLTLINKENISLLKKINPSIIQVSLYSMDAKTHDYITQLSGSFEKTINAIKLLLKNDIPVSISCPVTKNNFTHFNNVLKWARENRINASTDLNLSAKTDFNSENLEHSTTLQQSEELLKEMLQEDKDWQDTLLNEYAKGIKTKDDLNQPPCSVGNDSMFISAEKNACPCPSWQSYLIADLKKETLKEAWNETNHRIKKLRKLKRKDFPEFVNSEYREFMNICMARNANNNNGKYMKMDKKNIAVAKLTKKLVDEYIQMNNN